VHALENGIGKLPLRMPFLGLYRHDIATMRTMTGVKDSRLLLALPKVMFTSVTEALQEAGCA
jgi:hypothetical protein